MGEIPTFDDLGEIYCSNLIPKSAGYFFGAETTEVVDVFFPYAIALDGYPKT